PHRMSDQGEAVDVKTVEQRDRGSRHRVEAISESWLGRLAEADLVWGNHPITRLGQRLDGRLPITGGEISTVQEDDCPSCRRAGGSRVHISETQILALKRERHEMDGVWIGKSLERNPHRFGARRWRGESSQHDHCDRQTTGDGAARHHGDNPREVNAPPSFAEAHWAREEPD